MALSPKQIENRNSIRAKGRKHHFVYTGILRFGISMFVLTTFLSWCTPKGMVAIFCETQ